MFLIAEAAWKPTTVRVGGVMVDLARGQCAHSVRYLAKRWAWSKSRVDRFLTRLKTGTLIGTAVGQGVTVITICKYDEYQIVWLPSGTASGTARGTRAGQQRDREEDKEYSDTIVSGAKVARDDPKARLFNELLASVMRQTGKSREPAAKLIGKWRKACGDDDAKILDKLRQAEQRQVADVVSWVTKALQEQSMHAFLWARA